MKWTAPKIVEVPVRMEINMYACASTHASNAVKKSICGTSLSRPLS